MTLAEARYLLSKYADNGVCATDSRVVSRINEAQRRLYAIRPWVGVMAKAIVAVVEAEVGGVVRKAFNLPQGEQLTVGTGTLAGFGFDSLSRVCEYAPSVSETNSPTTAYPYIKTNGVQAFVNESMGMLQIEADPNLPTRYLISLPKAAPGFTTTKTITHVEITGRLKFRPVVLETDLLLIDDIDALKLQMLALWREENNQMDLTKTLEAKAVEHLSAKTDSAIEIARKAAYQSSSAKYQYGTMGFVRSKIALDIKNGLRLDDGELIDLINKGVDLLVAEYNFLLKNGRYGVKDNVPLLTHEFTYNDEQMLPIQDYRALRLGVSAIQALNSNQMEAATAFKKEAIEEMETSLATEVETKRHTTYQAALNAAPLGSLGYVKARLALDIKNGLSYSSSELTEMVNKAQERLVQEYNSLIKAGRYGVKDEIALLAYAPLYSDVGGLAVTDYSAIRYIVLANIEISVNGGENIQKATNLETLAISRLESNLLTALEVKRHGVYQTELESSTYMSFGYLISRLSLELQDGLKYSKDEIRQVISKGIEKLSQRYNYLIKAGRFGVKSELAELTLQVPSYDSALPPVPFRDYDLIKLISMSVVYFNANQLDASKNVEEQAFRKLEDKVTIDLESKRHAEYQNILDAAAPNTYGHIKARLALELPNGLKLSEKELTELVVKSQEKLVRHYNFLITAGRLGVKKPLPKVDTNYTPQNSALPPIKEYEAIKYAALSISAVMAGQQDQAMLLDKEAQTVLEQSLTTGLETDRHELYKNAITSAASDSFGYFKARLALDIPDGLQMTDDEVGRFINRAEETLILKGKWPGTVDETKLTLPEDGNIHLPSNLETILSAAASDGRAIPVYGRQYDFHENGPGYSVSDDNNNVLSLIDRGETFVEGRRVRVYFVRGNSGAEKCVRILYKRKFAPHMTAEDKMFILNYPAILEMVLALKAQATSPEVAKYHENNAIQLLRSELQENQSGNRFNLKVQAKAFAISEVPSLV